MQAAARASETRRGERSQAKHRAADAPARAAASARCCDAADDGVVALNVGGEVFCTTVATLAKEPDSLLARAAGGAHVAGIRLCVDGTLFVDREATAFHLVLRHLRGRLDVASLDATQRAQLPDDAEFYRLPALRAALKAAPLSFALPYTGAPVEHGLFNWVRTERGTTAWRHPEATGLVHVSCWETQLITRPGGSWFIDGLCQSLCV